MRLEPGEPENESGFYASLRKSTYGRLYLERVEPANESGFPDIYFVVRDTKSLTHLGGCEGTIELKYAKTQEPNLKTLVRGNQKAALLEYYEGGGRRRFALCYCNGKVFYWNTADYREALRGKANPNWTAVWALDNPMATTWLVNELEK